MPGFDDLSTEIVDLIFDKLDVDFAPRLTLKRASLVCKKWHKLAIPRLFRIITFIVASTPANDRREAFFEFLFARDDVKGSIKEVFVVVTEPSLPMAFQDQLQRLLPMLPNLDIVRLGGSSLEMMLFGDDEGSDDDDDFEITWLNAFRRSILDSLTELKVSASVEHYVQTLDHELNLKTVNCLTVFNAALVCPEQFERSYDAKPSDDVAGIINSNPNLTHLELGLTGWISEIPTQGPFEDEKAHALERLAPDLQNLESLVLRDQFVLSDQAWQSWQSKVRWDHLKSLSLLSHNLVNQFTSVLENSCSSLKTIKLNNYINAPWTEEPSFPEAPSSLKSILSSSSIENVSLTGFRPEVLKTCAKDIGANMRCIRFHIKETIRERFHTPGPPHDELLLNTNDIKQLQYHCPRLQWLGIDLYRKDLPSADMTLEDDRFLHLDSLTAFSSLSDIRFFIHDNPDGDEIKDKDVMATFQYLRSHKRGVPIERLTVCWNHGGANGVWVVWDLGPGQAVLEAGNHTTKTQHYSWDWGLWDTDKLEKKEDIGAPVQTQNEGVKLFHEVGGDHAFAVPEGW